MVTHNPELAYKYSTRIVELKDGLVVSDSAPYSEEEEREEVLSHRAEVQSQQAEVAQEAEEGAGEQKSAGKAKRLRTKSTPQCRL